MQTESELQLIILAGPSVTRGTLRVCQYTASAETGRDASVWCAASDDYTKTINKPGHLHCS